MKMMIIMMKFKFKKKILILKFGNYFMIMQRLFYLKINRLLDLIYCYLN